MVRKRGQVITQNPKAWHEKELELLATDRSDEELAKELNRTVAAVQIKRRKLRRAQKPERPTTVEEDVAKKTDVYWKEQFRLLSAKYDKLARNQSLVDRLVDEITFLAPKSYSSAPTIFKARPSSGSSQSGVLLLSDSHVGQVISPNQTLGFGGYDFTKFLERLKFLESSVASILENHTNAKVSELVVPILGDIIDGALGHGAEAGQLNPTFNQFFFGAHAIAQFLRNLAAYVPAVRIFCVAGNHPRWPHQKKMPTLNRFSNLDTFLYVMIAALTRDVKNITWRIDSQPVAVFGVQGFECFALHGDTWRGGDKALGIPVHSIGRQISATTQLYSKSKQSTPNYYLAGHFHSPMTLSHTNGEVLVNGAFPGVDTYAMASNFTPCDPIQRLFFVHPTYGKTASYDIKLKHAPVGEKTYVMPEGFEIR